MSRLVIYGCGGFGREVASAAIAAGRPPVAYIDDGGTRSAVGDVPVHPFAWLEALDEPVGVFVAIADIGVRRRLEARQRCRFELDVLPEKR